MSCGGLSPLTPGAERILWRCRLTARSFRVSSAYWPALLLSALIEDESLASATLRGAGITLQQLQNSPLAEIMATLPPLISPQTAEITEAVASTSGVLPDDPDSLIRIIDAARTMTRQLSNDSLISSELLLLATASGSNIIQESLESLGLTINDLRFRMFDIEQIDSEPLAVDEPLSLCVDTAPASFAAASDMETRPISAPVALPQDQTDSLYRVLDACLNRAREGLRVLEDYCRFFCPRTELLSELKSLRHELCAAEQLASVKDLLPGRLRARDTLSDAGTTLTHPHEQRRSDADQIRIANLRRVQESLRSLEEFGKLLSTEFAEAMKQLRYRTYVIEKPLLSGCEDNNSRSVRLRRSQLYVLITESQCRLPWKEVVQQALAGGADILQLREKHCSDRELLQRADWIRHACTEADALFVLNDRADLAVAATADGLHVGQEELPADQARRLLATGTLLGLSTHALHQLQHAVSGGADYIGVGPVFPSETKQFHSFPGLDYVREASAECPIPWFAIGGISTENLPRLLTTGCQRIAVTAAVTATDHPRDAARNLKDQLPLLTSGQPRWDT